MVSVHWLLLIFIDYYITGGVDYESGPYTASIPAGDTSGSFDVRIIDNNIFEEDETFTLTIRESSLPSLIMPMLMCRLEVTIVDDDCEFTILHTVKSYGSDTR